MAGPVNHIILGERAFKNIFHDSPKGDFFVGTMFPDIRYLGVIRREETHINELKISDIKDEGCFKVGMKIHSYVDHIREKQATVNNLYSRAMEMARANQCLKLLEDELFYDDYENWDMVADCFENVLDGELRWGVEKDDVMRWHEALQNYLKQKPSEKTRHKLLLSIGFTRSAVEKINQSVVELKSDKRFLDIIKKTYKDIQKEIDQYGKEKN